MPDPLEVATFRFEVIASLRDDKSPRGTRQRLLRKLGRHRIRWPTGDEKPVARSTAYRWLKAHRLGGLRALEPKTRRDKGQPRKDRSAAVDRAVALLLERPQRSLELVLKLLEAEDLGLGLTRSTLQREIARHRLYEEVRRARSGERKTRRRFEAEAPHDIWQLDAKGPVTVHIGGREMRVTILSILDDHSRVLLAVTAAGREKLGPAVRLFRAAAARWGVPRRLYCDRHAVYDSVAFRRGLAELGLHRIRSRSRNAPARGKIERYHGFLSSWFLGELAHQVVLSWAHLEDLLQAFRDLLYNPHRHRGLKMSPAERLADRRSPRLVTVEQLADAFWVRKTMKAHKRTGEVDLPGGLVRVPPRLAGLRVRLCWDPADPGRIRLIEAGGSEIPLTPIGPTPTPKLPATPPPPPTAPGRLQRLVDRWRGRELPQAEPGFGLPEVFEALSAYLGRRVPDTQREAATVQAFYRVNGPFRASDLGLALDRARSTLGEGRPLSIVLAFLVKEAQRARTQQQQQEEAL